MGVQKQAALPQAAGDLGAHSKRVTWHASAEEVLAPIHPMLTLRGGMSPGLGGDSQGRYIRGNGGSFHGQFAAGKRLWGRAWLDSRI